MESGKTSPPGTPQSRVTDFTELETWKRARVLRNELYRVVKTFPNEEKFGLASQIRRAASSVTANLAEGYGRYSFQENMQFCRVSRGSLYELRDHLTTALDAGYIPKARYDELDAMAVSAVRPVNGYIRATKNLKALAKPDEMKWKAMLRKSTGVAIFHFLSSSLRS
jgi:four helix bundle protein